MAILLLLVPTLTFGMVQEVEIPDVDLTNADTLVSILMPVLTLAAAWGAKKLLPFIKGTVTLIVVPVLAGLIGLLANWVAGTDLSMLMTVLTGSAAVLLHQLYVNITKPEIAGA